MNPLRHLRYTIFALLAVLCLLGLQYGAAMHGLSHLTAEKHSEQQKHLPNEKTCDKCMVYAEIGAGAPTTAHATISAVASSIDIATTPRRYFPFLDPTPYSARAPPTSDLI
jgi:hypothetical protein